MNPIGVIAILSLLIVYIVVGLIYIKGSEKRKEIQLIMDVGVEKRIKTFSFEDKILDKLKIEPNKVRFVLYIERILIISVLGIAVFFIRGLALAAFGAIVTAIYFEDAYKKAIYESGITNIARITNFINYFVPHINSGNSADQSFLGYIKYSSDEELAEYYENRDNLEYELPTHLKQIVDIYDIAKYNEEQGISDYTYILNELSEDYSQKQIYYNSFISRISEIKPICWSYYFAVPFLIIVSLSQTWDFWIGFGGLICGFILLAFFFAFKLLIFKLQKKTIVTIF